MSFNVRNRKAHHWASFAATLPLLVIITTGVLLQLKKHWTWVQPAEQRGTGTVPAVTFEQVLAAVRGVRELGVAGWDDVDRLDVRPGRGIVKVWLRNGWEVQVDLSTGRVLQSAYRRSDAIEAIHDGSFLLGDWSKLGLFLPAGLTLLFLWMSGMWMVWVQFSGKRRRKKLAHRRHAAVILLLAGAATGASQGARTPLKVTPVLGHWEHVTEQDGTAVLADATKWRAEASPIGFPLATLPGVTFSEGTLRVKFKLIGGASDQIAGLAFNVTPKGEYYFARYNTKDGNVAIWQFTKGERVRLADGTDHLPLPLNTWHDLHVRVAGRRVTAIVNGTLRVSQDLPSPIKGGVGFWTKRDSVTAFKDFAIESRR